MADEENPVEPLISKPESYGSVAGSNPVGSPVGLANTMPNEGYCLVFEQLPEYGLGANKDEPYKITQQDGTLKIDSNFNDINAYKEDGWEEKLQEALVRKKIQKHHMIYYQILKTQEFHITLLLIKLINIFM
eukprot:124220_1